MQGDRDTPFHPFCGLWRNELKVLEYLQRKYESDRPMSLLNAEAKIFGIPTPLEAGWLQRHADTEITPPMVFRLRQSLELRAKKGHQYAQIALANIVDLPCEEGQLSPPEKKAKKLRNRRKVNKEKREKRLASKPSVMKDEFLDSYEWRKIRMVALKKYGRKCQCCGATPATGAIMNVDHIKPRRIYPELALDIDNLQILCHECNHGKGNWDMTDWRSDSPVSI